MNSPSFQITTSEYYDNNTSLVDDINFLSDWNNLITDQKIANMVMKFIYCYYYNNEINTAVAFQEIIHFFNELNIIASDTLVSKSEIYARLGRLIWFYHIQDYALRMVCDITSTVELVKDILSRKLQKEAFDGKYVWMDLWSWTWILTAANAIQARRNDFHDITNIWFEMWYVTAECSSRILQLLDLGKAIKQDTTKIELFSHIPQYNDITFISNETLCDPHRTMNKWRVKGDPFVENNLNLFGNGWVFINDATQFFPSQVRVQCKDDGTQIMLNKENQFTSPQVFCQDSPEYRVESISILDQQICLEQIWSNLRKQWCISQSPHMTPRWSTNRKK
jgi:hypothetical protein